ncbi:hypothetical protein D9758_017281 [Tetrapyrgos nigripes]|uniref:Uncharacterized protein n=1 Tax=Tetrapyrgos nigripes TaxID=182062 RepID=A0A8H5C2H9_9AGAR|nr:hypothetical protein D9758_017281 [Tetrapyrgos nigripes]
MELLRLYESTSPLRGHTPINMTLHHATLVSAEKLVNSFREYVWGEECLYQPEFSFSFLLEFRGAWFGVFVKGGVGLVSGASGVKVAKEGKRRVKGRFGSRAEDASLVLGFGASLSSAEHSFGSVSSVDYGDDTAGADSIPARAEYTHIKLCDFGVSGGLVFIYTNTFAGTSVYTSCWMMGNWILRISARSTGMGLYSHWSGR